MPLVSMRQLLDHAAEHGYGLPAFNVNNLEQVQAIMAAASETDSPVIMQASAGARKYAGETFLRVHPDALTRLAYEGMHDIAHYLRPGHLQQLRNILDDPELIGFLFESVQTERPAS